MTDHANDALDAMRVLSTRLLSSIDAWREQVVDPGHFRHRLLRAHALAVLDELEQFTPRCASGPPDRGTPERQGAALDGDRDPPRVSASAARA